MKGFSVHSVLLGVVPWAATLGHASEQHSSLRVEVWAEGGSRVWQTMGGTSAGRGEDLGWAWPSAPSRPLPVPQNLVLGVAGHAARPWVSRRKLVQTG